MAKHLIRIELPSSTDKCNERWCNYREMQDARQETAELKGAGRSNNFFQIRGQNFNFNSMFFPKKPETFSKIMKSGEKNYTEAMQKQLKSREKTETWDIVERPSGKKN